MLRNGKKRGVSFSNIIRHVPYAMHLLRKFITLSLCLMAGQTIG